MVFQKRLDYRFHSFQFPPTPRAARSARRRRSFRKTHEDSRVCAFDLLAIVAGKLLLENEPTSRSDNSSANQDLYENTVKQEIPDGENPLKVEAHNQESPSRSFSVSDIVTQVQEKNLSTKESVYRHDDLNLGLPSAITSKLQETSNPVKLVSDATENETEAIASRVEARSSCHGESSEFKLRGKIKRQRKHEHQESRMVQNGAVVNMCSLNDPVLWNKKSPAPVGLDTSPRVPLNRNRLPHSSYPPHWGDVDIVSRDDDENSSGCTYPRTTKKYFRSAPRIGDRRIRKILASRYWKVAPRLKDVTRSNIDLLKPVYRHRKNYYKNQRSEKIYPFKKRKYFQYNSPSNSDGAICSDFVEHSLQKGGDEDFFGCCQKHEGTRASSSITVENSSCQPRDSQVKLRIKSFRVPEIFIEVPQSATVASLKRTVMEAVVAVLGGGLRVGVLLHGKKVKDDNKTLLQTGISHNNQLDAVGFSLEPNHSQNFPSLCGGGSPVLFSCDSFQPLSRYSPSLSVVHHGTCAAPFEPQVNNLGFVESDSASAPSLVDMSMDKSTNNSKALVATPAVNVEALAVVPAHCKNKRSEIVQRRIRRPFSVAEVEALVQAVDKLGTGRWRDVKLRAFDNAKHRTYVDLKDKWKTLVHTAKISPQQRRGEPIPQELLDRVLTAHAYWSQLQAKQQQVKHPHPQPEETFLLQGPSNNSNWAVGGHV